MGRPTGIADRIRVIVVLLAALSVLIGLFVVEPHRAHGQNGPTLTVETTETNDPNGTFVLDIVLDSAGESIIGLSFDVLFDPTTLAIAGFERVAPAGGAFNASAPGRVRVGVFYTADALDPVDPRGFVGQNVIARITLEGQNLATASPVNVMIGDAFAADESRVSIGAVGGGITLAGGAPLPPTPIPTAGPSPTMTPTPTPRVGIPPVREPQPAFGPGLVLPPPPGDASVQLAYPGPINVVPPTPGGGVGGFGLNPQPALGSVPAGSGDRSVNGGGSDVEGRTGTGGGAPLANTGAQTNALATASITLVALGTAFTVLARRSQGVLR